LRAKGKGGQGTGEGEGKQACDGKKPKSGFFSGEKRGGVEGGRHRVFGKKRKKRKAVKKKGNEFSAEKESPWIGSTAERGKKKGEGKEGGPRFFRGESSGAFSLRSGESCAKFVLEGQGKEESHRTPQEVRGTLIRR